MRRVFLVTVVCVVGWTVGSGDPLRALTYRMIADEALADAAPLQVEGEVLRALPAPDARLPSTDYVVLVQRLLKGSISSSTILVRVLGGTGPDGLSFIVPGAPAYAPGEKVLLFLRPGAGGVYGIEQLALGSFRRSGEGGEALAVRELWQARRLDGGGEDGLRNYGRFSRWLRDRARGVHRSADYFVDGRELEAVPQAFNLTRIDGRRARWFHFDDGGEVVWTMDSRGFDGAGSGFRNMQNAIAAWSDHSGTSINYVFGGRSKSLSGFTGSDGANTVIFNDPNGEIEGSFSCAEGGTLAIGGFWFNGTTGTFDGKTFFRIIEGDIITQNGTGCFWDDDPVVREEVLAHEFGHTLGIGHSCGGDRGPCDTIRKDEALMRSFVHDDGRGATLSDDDWAAADRLYGTGEDPAAPSDLEAAVEGGSSVRLSWTDNSDDELAFKVQQAGAVGGFGLAATVAADLTETVISGLAPGTYRFRVRANRPMGRTRFSNEVSVTLGGSGAPPQQAGAPGPDDGGGDDARRGPQRPVVPRPESGLYGRFGPILWR